MASDNIRKKILTAARKLFQENGLGTVTMEDIAQATGKGKSTLYYYFKSKEEIFNAVIESEMDDIIIETMKRVSQSNYLQGKLEAFAFTKYEMSYKRKSLYKATESGMDADELSNYTQIKKKIHQKYLQKEKLVLKQLLISAIEKEEIRQLNNAELENMVFIYLSSLRGINREILTHGTTLEASDTILTFCELFYDGLK